MITTKRPNTDDYTQVGFIEAKDSNGVYQNIDKIYDNQGNIVFQQGYLNEYVGADDFSIPAIGKPLLDYTIYGNTVQDGKFSATVVGVDSINNQAYFYIWDFPKINVGDTIVVTKNNHLYPLMVQKIDETYVYLENQEV